MSQPVAPVVVVGAGLAGLACTVALHDAGIPVTVLQASVGVGGRTPPTYTSASVAASGDDLEPGDDSVALTSA